MRFGPFRMCPVCEARPAINHVWEVAGEVIHLHICEPCVEELNALIAQCEQTQRWMDDML